MSDYHAKLVIQARDGSSLANRLFRDEMVRGFTGEEVVEFYFLSMDPEIYVDSQKHKRLIELTKQLEIPEVLQTETF